MAYEIIESTDKQEFEQMLGRQLAAGFKPVGSMCMVAFPDLETGKFVINYAIPTYKWCQSEGHDVDCSG